MSTPKAEMTAWDLELAALVSEVDDVVQAKKIRARGRRDAMALRKVRLVQAGMRLDRVLKRLGQLLSREHLLLARERAFLHWGKIYLDTAANRAAAERDILNKNLWLRLVRSRITGGAARAEKEASEDASFLDGDQLVELTVRHANLAKTERFLKGALKDLDSDEQKLVAAYHALAVEKANRGASQSLASRLGATPEDALTGLGQAALGGYLRGLFVLAKGGEAREVFFGLEERYAEKARTLVLTARNVVLSSKPDAPKRPRQRSMNRMNAALRQLDDLEKDLQSAYLQQLGPFASPFTALADATAKTGANSLK